MQSVKINNEKTEWFYLPSTKIDPVRLYAELGESFRDQAIHAANARCQGCGIGGQHVLELDHGYLPHSKGGKTDAANVWVLCSGCNKVKADVIPPQGFKPHTFPMTDLISISEVNQNHSQFRRMVCQWRLLERQGLVAFGRYARTAPNKPWTIDRIFSKMSKGQRSQRVRELILL